MRAQTMPTENVTHQAQAASEYDAGYVRTVE